LFRLEDINKKTYSEENLLKKWKTY
jgi:hypothetical protein